jgi:hypothetical protein
MSDIAPVLDLEQAADDEAGEFTLPRVEPETAADPEQEHDRYDGQILAALVSP